MVNGNINVAPPPIITTQPDHILRHSISDEELDMLCEVRSDFVREFLWIGIGGTLGAMASAIAAANTYFSGKVDVALGVSDFSQVIILFVSLTMCIVAGVVSVLKTKRSKDLRESIRARTKGTQ